MANERPSHSNHKRLVLLALASASVAIAVTALAVFAGGTAPASLDMGQGPNLATQPTATAPNDATGTPPERTPAPGATATPPRFVEPNCPGRDHSHVNIQKIQDRLIDSSARELNDREIVLEYRGKQFLIQGWAEGIVLIMPTQTTDGDFSAVAQAIDSVRYEC